MATVLDTFITIFEYKVEGMDRLKQASANAKRIGASMTRNFTLPFVALTVGVAKLASDMEETQNKIGESFMGSADAVREWSKTSITAMGLAQQSALDTAALFGDIGTGIGLEEEDAAQMAMTLTQLTADLASFKNIRQSVAETALTGIFTGETESLKRLGIIITENNLKSYAMKHGLNANLEKMNALEKVSLRYKVVMDATSKAQGDFVRTGGSAANQTRMLLENLKEAGAVIGQTVLPPITRGIVKLNKVIIQATKWWSSLDLVWRQAIFVMGAVTAAIGPLITGVANLALALQYLWANPIGAVIAALVGIVTAIVLVISWIRKLKSAFYGVDDLFGDANITHKAVPAKATPFLTPARAAIPRGTPRSRVMQDNRVINVATEVAVNEATDGKRVGRIAAQTIADELSNATQNFTTPEV